jgi:hypothetical protein
MGIVNLVADSFSGDGLTNRRRSRSRPPATADGASIIDIGAERSLRADPEADEIAQLLRFIERWPSCAPALGRRPGRFSPSTRGARASRCRAPAWRRYSQ